MFFFSRQSIDWARAFKYWLMMTLGCTLSNSQLTSNDTIDYFCTDFRRFFFSWALIVGYIACLVENDFIVHHRCRLCCRHNRCCCRLHIQQFSFILSFCFFCLEYFFFSFRLGIVSYFALSYKLCLLTLFKMPRLICLRADKKFFFLCCK